jgi:hypothetical protein
MNIGEYLALEFEDASGTEGREVPLMPGREVGVTPLGESDPEDRPEELPGCPCTGGCLARCVAGGIFCMLSLFLPSSQEVGADFKKRD